MPYGTSLNLADVVKPLLDGIISAFQVYDGTDMPSTKVRLSDLIGVDQDIVVNILTDSATSILGKTRLLHPFGTGVQWNPVDDRCIAVKILCEQVLELVHGR